MSRPTPGAPQQCSIGDLHHFVVPRQAETSCFMNELANSVGVRFRKELCGLAVLKSTRHSSMTSLAS